MSTATTLNARCATHIDRPAVATCSRCGDYACSACFDSLAGQCSACEAIAGASPYHVVPVGRFAAMIVLTMGLYHVYWMYKQWVAIKQRDQSDIWPAARAFFSGFTFFSLIDDINATSLQRDLPPLSKVPAVVLLIGGALSRLPDPFGLISSLAGLAVVPACERIWALSSAQAREANASFSTRHGVVSVLGIIVWALVILGLVLPEPEPELEPYDYYDTADY